MRSRFNPSCRLGGRLLTPLVVASLALIMTGPALATEMVTGVRGKVMELFEAKNGSVVKQLSRRDGRALKDNPLPILTSDGDWIAVDYQGTQVWLQKQQAQISGDRPTLSCGGKMGGSSAGASRGIGEGCKN